jgi:hypothetical protein
MKDRRRLTRFFGTGLVLTSLCVTAAPGVDPVEADQQSIDEQLEPAAVLSAEGASDANSQEQKRPCSSTAYRAFDFWVGEWTVTMPSRQGWSAQSVISRHNDGCSIHEAYHAAGGYRGSSINFFDQTDQKWHQTWIDNQGGALYLQGGPIEGGMVLSDPGNRITWIALDDGRVRQHWESTTDGGATWTTAFDGYYARSPGSH